MPTLATAILIPQRSPEPHEALYVDAYVSAGKPVPIDDVVVSKVDMFDYLVGDSGMMCLVPVAGDSMTGDGINDGDTLIVNRSIEAKHGDIVVALVDNDLTVKRMSDVGGRLWLVPSNPQHKTIKPTRQQSCCVWGVVVGSYTKHR